MLRLRGVLIQSQILQSFITGRRGGNAIMSKPRNRRGEDPDRSVGTIMSKPRNRRGEDPDRSVGTIMQFKKTWLSELQNCKIRQNNQGILIQSYKSILLIYCMIIETI